MPQAAGAPEAQVASLTGDSLPLRASFPVAAARAAGAPLAAPAGEGGSPRARSGAGGDYAPDGRVAGWVAARTGPLALPYAHGPAGGGELGARANGECSARGCCLVDSTLL